MSEQRPFSSKPKPEFGRLNRILVLGRMSLLWEQVWRLSMPLLLVVGLFLIVSLLGLWTAVPHWGRVLGLGFFGLGVVFCLVRFRALHWPTRMQVLNRLDQRSAGGGRLASSLDDELSAVTSDDPATQAMWQWHRKRLDRAAMDLRAGLPTPRLVLLDPFAVRAGILVAVVASAFIAGPEKYSRLRSAFDWQGSVLTASATRLDAWIDPPPYTGRAPIFLDIETRVAGGPVMAPIGSVLIVRSVGGAVSVEHDGAIERMEGKPSVTREHAVSSSPDLDLRFILKGSSRVHVLRNGSRVGSFDLGTIPDEAPRIALVGGLTANARGSLTLNYKIEDDYGVVAAEARFFAPSLNGLTLKGRSLFEPPRLPLVLPNGPSGLGEGQTTADLAAHPWAGARVSLILSAKDEAGNEGLSAAEEVTLPQRRFMKPLARALIEQRRLLALAPDQRGKILGSLEALNVAPDVYDVPAAEYLGLRTAARRLRMARTDAQLIEVVDFLWEMANWIEDGGVSEAEKELRAAQQALREALQRNAPEKDIKQLSEQLRAAMDKFLQEMAQQQKRELGDQADQGKANPGADDNRAVSPDDLKAMLNRMEEMMKSGNHAEAQKMLEQLQSILENLQTAKRQPDNPAVREMGKAMDELDRLTREQQDLRDETFRDKPSRPGSNKPATKQKDLRGGLDDSEDGEDQDSATNNETRQKPGDEASKSATNELKQRQEALRKRLKDVQDKMKQLGAEQEPGLQDADKAMKDAEGALEKGSQAKGRAVDAQGRALEALRRGAQSLTEKMQQQGEGDPSQQSGSNQRPGSSGQGEQGNRDPLGRTTKDGKGTNPRAKYDPMGTPAAQRAQRVLEELRRRMSEPGRTQDELDYFERLLRKY